jgi:MFS family permease
VVLYSPRIFNKAGIKDRNHLLIATMGVGLTKIICILVATILLDRVGRRPLLLTSLAGMFISLAMLGVGLTVIEHTSEKLVWAIALSISTVFTFVAFFSVGLGPITWFYSSEIFPLRLRAQGASLGVAVNRLMNGAISMSFISLYHAITIGGAFFLFSGFAVLAWLFFFFFCPETRGHPLEEMEDLFSKNGRRDGN